MTSDTSVLQSYEDDFQCACDVCTSLVETRQRYAFRHWLGRVIRSLPPSVTWFERTGHLPLGEYLGPRLAVFAAFADLCVAALRAR